MQCQISSSQQDLACLESLLSSRRREFEILCRETQRGDFETVYSLEERVLMQSERVNLRRAYENLRRRVIYLKKQSLDKSIDLEFPQATPVTEGLNVDI